MELGTQHDFSSTDATNTLTDGANQGSLAKNILTGSFGTQIPQKIDGRLVPDGLIKGAEEISGLSWVEITGRGRQDQLLGARAGIAALLRVRHPRPWTLKAMGILLDRDHSTMLNSLRVVADGFGGFNGRKAKIATDMLCDLDKVITWPDAQVDGPPLKPSPMILAWRAYGLSLKGLSHRQIGAEMGLSRGTAGNYVKKGRMMAGHPS